MGSRYDLAQNVPGVLEWAGRGTLPTLMASKRGGERVLVHPVYEDPPQLHFQTVGKPPSRLSPQNRLRRGRVESEGNLDHRPPRRLMVGPATPLL